MDPNGTPFFFLRCFVLKIRVIANPTNPTMKSFVFLGLGLLSFAQLGVTASTPSFSWMNISDPPGVRAAKVVNVCLSTRMLNIDQ